MGFQLSNEQIRQLMEEYTRTEPTTGDLFLWGKVDRLERKADKKDSNDPNDPGKAQKKIAKAEELEAKGGWLNEMRARWKRNKAARKMRKAKDKRRRAQDIKDRPDYWLRRDEE
jgi:uncharacterized protein with von Willebrand factor type A (vWA) domain|tara:strand:+ start:82 stop:423 length:342 start_codon:yes stop_codon:yes gene_type:complete